MSYKLYVGNLPIQCPEEVILTTLKDKFSSLGTIEDLFIIRDKLTNMHRGFGFITIKEETGARKALAMAGKILFAGCDKGIKMDVARERRQHPMHAAAPYPAQHPMGHHPAGFQQPPIYAAQPQYYQGQPQPPLYAAQPNHQVPQQLMPTDVGPQLGPNLPGHGESTNRLGDQSLEVPLQPAYESASLDNIGNFKDEWEGLPA